MQTEPCTLSFRLGEKTPGVVRRCFEALSYREASEEDEEHWNIHWRVGNFKTGDWERCLPHQRINHLPKAWHITTKDHLVRSMRVMSSSYGSVYSFTPLSWILPSEYTKFMRDYYQEREKDESCLFIAKPADLSRGRGIYLVRDLSEIVYDQPYILQQYVQRPLTIDGFKFDLRIYVVVLSVHPLVAFVYNQGIARFATHKYSTETIDDLFVHLTNASINKNAPDAEEVAAAASTIAGSDCKQLMSSVWSLLKERGINTTRLWERICRILTATVAILVTKVPNVPEVASGFELFGFDVLLDSECRPWLMEVNCSPALSMDGPVDTQVKVPLLKDTFQMVSLHTRALKLPATSEVPSGRSSLAALSKVASSSSTAANQTTGTRRAATDLHKSSRSLSAPRLGITSTGCDISEPASATLQARLKPATGAAVTRAPLQAAALSKPKCDVLSARSFASGKPPLSCRPMLSTRPPLPPASVHVADASATRARRPSLDEGGVPVVAPSACVAVRAPTSQQLRADALPTAVMNFVAEANALVEGRFSCLWPISFRQAQLSVDASRTCDIKAMVSELKLHARESKTTSATADNGI